MRHEVVRTAEEWNSLRSEWNDLLFESHANTVFLTWQWLDTWLQLQDTKPQLLVVCVRDEQGRLRGLAPLYSMQYSLVGVVPYRVLRVIGDTNSGAEYQTWIAGSGDYAEVFAEIVAALRAHTADWDLIWMPKLSTWSGLPEAIVDAMNQGGLSTSQRPCIFSAISLESDFERYLANLSSNRRQQIRKIQRKALSEPGIEFKKVCTQADVDTALAALFELHDSRWRSAGIEGAFSKNPKEKQFYQHFAPKALEHGWLAMYVMLVSGVPKAVQFGYLYGGTFLQLQEGFDPDYAMQGGNALRAYVIEDCIKNGISEYDFLAGTSEHKRRWRGEERLGIDLLAARSCLKNIPIMRAGIWPTGAYLRSLSEGR